MLVFEYLNYFIFDNGYGYELYHGYNCVCVYSDINDAIDAIPFSEYI